jgi:hypothetical protein
MTTSAGAWSASGSHTGAAATASSTRSSKGIERRHFPDQNFVGKKLPMLFMEEDEVVAGAGAGEGAEPSEDFFPPASSKDTEYHIMKFCSFSSALVHNVISEQAMKVDFPFKGGTSATRKRSSASRASNPRPPPTAVSRSYDSRPRNSTKSRTSPQCQEPTVSRGWNALFDCQIFNINLVGLHHSIYSIQTSIFRFRSLSWSRALQFLTLNLTLALLCDVFFVSVRFEFQVTC